MKNIFHQHAKSKLRKDSLVDFIRRFSDVDKQNVLNKLKLFAIVFSLNISCFVKTPSRMTIFALQKLTNQSKYLRKQLKADV